MTIVPIRASGRSLVLGASATLLLLGAASLGPALVLDVLAGRGDDLAHLRLVQVRAPRLALAALAGAALGVAGALLQDALRNPLAGPELLGVSSGGALVAAVVTVLHLPLPLAVRPAAVLAGATLAGLVVLGAAGRAADGLRIVLVGAAVSSVLSGLVVAAVSLGTAGDVDLLLRYLLGSLAGRSWADVALVACGVAPALGAAWLLRRPLGVLALGDAAATGLGTRPGRLRLVLLLVAVVLTAAVVAACGPIAFVALLAPHLVRTIGGSSLSSTVVPGSALAGAVLLVAADLLARTVLSPVELPVGIVTTALGVPLLLARLRSNA